MVGCKQSWHELLLTHSGGTHFSMIFYSQRSVTATWSNLAINIVFRKSPTNNMPPPTPSYSDVNNSPHGEDEDHPQQNGCGPLQTIGMLGARIKSSKSLQNLEISTKDSLRQVVDRTTNMGENMKHKYGSRMDMNRGKYDKFKDDPECDEENSGPQDHWR